MLETHHFVYNQNYFSTLASLVPFQKSMNVSKSHLLYNLHEFIEIQPFKQLTCFACNGNTIIITLKI